LQKGVYMSQQIIRKYEVLLEVNGDTGAILQGAAEATAFGVTVTRTAAGRYTISAPSWNAFGLQLTARTSDGNTTDRDNKKIQYRSTGATSYEVSTTVDDNGGTADPYEDEHFIVLLKEF